MRWHLKQQLTAAAAARLFQFHSLKLTLQQNPGKCRTRSDAFCASQLNDHKQLGNKANLFLSQLVKVLAAENSTFNSFQV